MMVSSWCKQNAQRISGYVKSFAPIMFIQAMIKSPKFTGAICPSSKKLAFNMVKHIDPNAHGIVIELGGGTGAITQAILERGVNPGVLYVIEYSEIMTKHLRERFPDVHIINGNAADLDKLIPPGVTINAIVSSLPLISLPPELSQEILKQWSSLLHKNGKAIQFTYNLRSPLWHKSLSPSKQSQEIVWANLPPAKVMVFEFKPYQ